jgi:hypothetical protein
MTIRAKFRCNSVVTYQNEDFGRKYEFTALYDTSIPEDRRYAKYTPSGRVEILVTNPDVTFAPGKDYYFDITEATE